MPQLWNSTEGGFAGGTRAGAGTDPATNTPRPTESAPLSPLSEAKRSASPPPARGRKAEIKAPGPFPVPSIILIVLIFCEALFTGILSLVILLVGAAFAAGGEKGGDALQRVLILEGGGKIEEEKVIVDPEGNKIRRIVYVDGEGQRQTAESPILEKEHRKGVQEAGKFMVIFSLLLAVFSLGKLVSALLFLLRKNLGRLGLVALCGSEGALILIFTLKDFYFDLMYLLLIAFNLLVVVIFLGKQAKAAIK